MGGGRAGTGVAAMEGGVLVPAETHGESMQNQCHRTNVVVTGLTLSHWSAGGGKGPEI